MKLMSSRGLGTSHPNPILDQITRIRTAGLRTGPAASGRCPSEIEGPIAIVMLAGLIISAILNLLFLPTLSLRFARFGKDEGAGARETF